MAGHRALPCHWLSLFSYSSPDNSCHTVYSLREVLSGLSHWDGDDSVDALMVYAATKHCVNHLAGFILADN